MTASNLRSIRQTHFSKNLGLALLITSMTIANASATSLSEKLTKLGHPNTKICQQSKISKGLGKLLVVQFEKQASKEQAQQKTTALLELLSQAFINAGQTYVGFRGTKRWETCQDRHPSFVYWRDYANKWRSLDDAPVKYLKALESKLDQALRGTPAEAFVLFSLGLVEQRLNQLEPSVKRFEKAYEILQDTDDPNGIKPKILIPLIYHHFGKDGDESQGQLYLNAYALVAKKTPENKANYLPLIKVSPVYPERAFRNRRTGYVVLEFTVDADGKVIDPVVIEESPTGLFGDAAMDAAVAFRYIPSIVDGVRVSTTGIRNKITFDIE